MNAPEQLDIFESEARKKRGMEQALNNADLKNQGVRKWSNRALEFVRIYPKPQFMAEDLREWAHSHGLPKPPSARAWGGVIVKAKNEGIIKHSGTFGFVKNIKAHRTPAAIWIKLK